MACGRSAAIGDGECGGGDDALIIERTFMSFYDFDQGAPPMN